MMMYMELSKENKTPARLNHPLKTLEYPLKTLAIEDAYRGIYIEREKEREI